MKVSNRLINIKGRQLPQENIIQGNNHRYAAGDTTDGWTRDMRYNLVYHLPLSLLVYLEMVHILDILLKVLICLL